MKQWLLSAAAGLLLAGCATRFQEGVRQQFGESMVFVGQEPAALARPPLRGNSVHVRSEYLPAGSTDYLEGQDFIVDYAAGTIRRTIGSRLPDFQTNILFDKNPFDHTQFPGYGNLKFFGFVDYSYRGSNSWPPQASQLPFLQRSRARLLAGKPFKIVAFGDSITAGGEATKPELIFWQRWAEALRAKYPAAPITAANGATGGDTTVQGLQRLQAKVLDEKPDLVLIGFGMNDNNKGSVPLTSFAANLKEMIARIRAATRAEIILFSAFPPNPKWVYGSGQMAQYAAATAGVARETQCAYADVFDNWQAVAARKKPEDLLGNNINHPNDFGHWIYFQALSQIGL